MSTQSAGSWALIWRVRSERVTCSVWGVPADWVDISGTAYVSFDGRPIGVHLAASPDLGQVYDDSFSAPGVFIGATSDDAPGFDAEAYLGSIRPNTTYGCDLAGRHPVTLQLSGATFSGTLASWRGCRDGRLALGQAALVRQDGALALVIDMRALDGADAAAIRRALETLTLPARVATPGGAPATPTPGPPG